jgi:WD40 repeat protein
MNECPSPEALGQLLAGDLAGPGADAVRAHLAGCPACQARMDALSEVPELRRLRAAAPPPAADTPPGLVERLLWGTPAPEGPRTLLPFLGPPAADGEVGTLGPYRLLCELGRGGMGVVFKAHDRDLGRTVAVKVLRAEGADDKARLRLVREARAAAAIAHDNVVAVYSAATLDGGPLYLVMQYVAGPSLRERVRAQGPLPPREAARVCREVAEGLHALHRAGLVHRDVKPANVLLEEGTGRARLTDFGLVRILERPDGATREGVVAGTPEYVSPEQVLQPERVDGRADVYGLGMTLYEALTGGPAFRGPPQAVIEQVLHAEPTPPRRLAPGTPRDLETICLKALAKAPARRYQTAREMAEDLGRWLAGEPIRARPVGRAERLLRWCRGHPLPAVLTAAVALLLLALAAGSSLSALWLRERRDDAVRAREVAERRLYESHVAHARAHRRSGRAGQRVHSLEALGEAARLLRRLGLGDAERLALRNEVIACLALTDLRPDPAAGPGYPLDGSDGNVALDAALERYALQDREGHIRVRRLEGGAEVARLEGRLPRSDPLPHLRFSLDGRWLAAKYYDGRALHVRVWGLADGRPVLTADGGGAWYEKDLDFSPDGATAALGLPDGAVGLYELPAGRLRQRLPPGPAPRCLRFHPAGHSLAVARADRLEVIRLADGRVTRTIPTDRPAGGVFWSPDGHRLACVGGGGRSVRVWDLRAGAVPLTLQGHQQETTHADFSPADDLIAATGWDGTTRLWCASTGAPLVTADGGRAFGSTTVFSRDGRWLGREGEMVGRWEVVPSRECRTVSQPNLSGAALSPDGRLLATAGQGGVWLWEAASGREVGRVPAAGVRFVLFHPQGSGLLVGGCERVFCLPLRPGPGGALEVGRADLHHRFGPDRGGSAVAADREGRRFVLSSARGAVLTGWGPGAAPARSLGPHEHLASVALSPDGRWVASGTHNGYGVIVWDAETGRRVKEWPCRSAHTAFSADGRWLAVSTAGTYRFYEVPTWELRHELTSGASAPGVMAFSGDGRLLALTHARRLVKLLDAATLRELATLEQPGPAVIGGLGLDERGGRLAVVAGDNQVRLWDLRAVRRRLAELGLDWAPPPDDDGPSWPVRVTLKIG